MTPDRVKHRGRSSSRGRGEMVRSASQGSVALSQISRTSAISKEVSDELAEIRRLLKSSAQLQAEHVSNASKIQSEKKPFEQKGNILKSDVKLQQFRLNDVGQRAIDLRD